MKTLNLRGGKVDPTWLDGIEGVPYAAAGRYRVIIGRGIVTLLLS